MFMFGVWNPVILKQPRKGCRSRIFRYVKLAFYRNVIGFDMVIFNVLIRR